MNKPRVSILSPIRNVEKHIGETIQSVLSQSYKDWEMILMDGASTDRTVEIVKEYAAKYPNIRIYSEKDEGSGHAFDKTFDLAEGEFFTTLCGQDGFLDRDWLKAAVEVFDRDKEVSLVWALAQQMDETGRLVEQPHISYSQFMEKQGPLRGIINLVKKMASVAGELVFANNKRRKVLLDKLFSRGAVLRVNLMTNRSFKGGEVPQKKEWFDYWLKTGLVFPDQSMIVARKVWFDCMPRYKMGEHSIGYLGDFYYDFNTKGYLPYYLPVYAMFGRLHPGQSHVRAGEELHRTFLEYGERVNDLSTKLHREHGSVKFKDREGAIVGEKKF